eukprot:21544_1
MGNKSSRSSSSSNNARRAVTVPNRQDVKDAFSELPGTKPRIKTGSKITAQKIAMAERTHVLSLGKHHLSQVPKKILELSGLRNLVLSHNSLKVLPPELGTQLPSLRILRVDANKLKELPDFSGSSSLTELSTAENHLTGVSCIKGLPTTLTTLCLSDNKSLVITFALFKEFNSYDSSPSIEVQHGGVPDAVFSDSLINLVTLVLDNCGICGLLPPLTGLPKLSDISLDGNCINGIGSNIRLVPTLKRLSLQGCAIEAERKWEEEENGKLMHASLSPELFTETSLCVLELAGNPLSKKGLLKMRGFDEFLERRKKNKDKVLAGGAIINHSLCGLD